MKLFDNGSYVRVLVYRREVEDFKNQWPCSRLPSKAISFDIDANNGDLVDIIGTNYDGEDLLALSQDANHFASIELNRPDLDR